MNTTIGRFGIRILSAALGICALLLAGCGGGGGSAPAAGTEDVPGTVTVSVQWPEARSALGSRLVPAASNAIKLMLTANGSTLAGPVTLVRPNTTATLTAPASGDALLTAAAYPNQDASGEAQAQTALHIVIPAGGTAYPLGGRAGDAIVLAMASTIVRVDLSPNPVSVVAGATIQVTATARASGGNTVMVPAATAFSWAITSGSACAAVSSSGLVTGLAAGQATLTVTESESGVKASATINVAPNTGTVPITIQ